MDAGVRLKPPPPPPPPPPQGAVPPLFFLSVGFICFGGGSSPLPKGETRVMLVVFQPPGVLPPKER